MLTHLILTFEEAGNVMSMLYMKILTPRDFMDLALHNTVSVLVFKPSS